MHIKRILTNMSQTTDASNTMYGMVTAEEMKKHIDTLVREVYEGDRAEIRWNQICTNEEEYEFIEYLFEYIEKDEEPGAIFRMIYNIMNGDDEDELIRRKTKYWTTRTKYD
jgi:hypothetical protein